MRLQLVDLYRQAEDYFFTAISLKTLNLDGVATAYMTGVPVADLNIVYIKKHTDLVDKILHQSKQFFHQFSFGFVVIIPEEFCTSEIDNIFKTLGYSETAKSISMVHNLEGLVVNNATSFDDETFISANDSELNEWMAPLIAYPDANLATCRKYAETHKLAQSKKCQILHFSLYQSDKPIASITLSLHNTNARIDDVGTLPELQGKGYATRLMTFALSEAKKLGVIHCFLEASDAGFSIYQKLGFETLFKNKIYSSDLERHI